MPVASNPYSVLKCRVLETRFGPDTNDHYQVLVTDNKSDYRIAINTKSQVNPFDLLYFASGNFQHPVTAKLPGINWGFHALASKPGGIALDYIRDNLFNTAQMRILPESAPPPANSLFTLIDGYMQLALKEKDAVIYAFGMEWKDPPGHPGPQYFKTKVSTGIHNIHMNQGNPPGKFGNENGVWQDGALMIQYPTEKRWVALFFAFQSQCFHTNDTTGQCLAHLPPGVPTPEWTDNPVKAPLRIVAALVNAGSAAPSGQSVTLVNSSNRPVNLKNWILSDQEKRQEILPDLTVEPGKAVRLSLSGQSIQLSPGGGIISLLNPDGLKVDGVSYTGAQAQDEGWTIVF